MADREGAAVRQAGTDALNHPPNLPLRTPGAEGTSSTSDNKPKKKSASVLVSSAPGPCPTKTEYCRQPGPGVRATDPGTMPPLAAPPVTLRSGTPDRGRQNLDDQCRSS